MLETAVIKVTGQSCTSASKNIRISADPLTHNSGTDKSIKWRQVNQSVVQNQVCTPSLCQSRWLNHVNSYRFPIKLYRSGQGYIKVTVRVNTRVYIFTLFNQRDKYAYNEVQIGGVKQRLNSISALHYQRKCEIDRTLQQLTIYRNYHYKESHQLSFQVIHYNHKKETQLLYRRSRITHIIRPLYIFQHSRSGVFPCNNIFVACQIFTLFSYNAAAVFY